MQLKMSSAKVAAILPGLNVLTVNDSGAGKDVLI